MDELLSESVDPGQVYIDRLKYKALVDELQAKVKERDRVIAEQFDEIKRLRCVISGMLADHWPPPSKTVEEIFGKGTQ